MHPNQTGHRYHATTAAIDIGSYYQLSVVTYYGYGYVHKKRGENPFHTERLEPSPPWPLPRAVEETQYI